MKHVKTLTNARPAKAQETAWVELKNVIVPGSGLTNTQAIWLAAQWDNWLQK